jgi:hypothetical protein
MRGAHFTREYQRASALARSYASDFAAHNQRIGVDSAARQRVILRTSKGSALLLASDVHQVSLADIRGPLGRPLSEEQQRIILASYIWTYLFEGLHVAPDKPSEKHFFELVALARSFVGYGLPLPNPLLVVFVAPGDFDRAQGPPLPKDRRKKRFRAALYEGRRYAEMLQALDDYFRSLTAGAVRFQTSGGKILAFQHPHVLKKRRPMASTGPVVDVRSRQSDT